MTMSLLASGLFPGEEDCQALQSPAQPVDCLHHQESAPHPHANSKCWDNSYEMILTPLDRCVVSSGSQWSVAGAGGVPGTGGSIPIPGRRRNCANRKERKRTQSINNAFADLRERIPNVPADTKLSKIKTLRLATSYIGYLLSMLERGDSTPTPGGGFAAELPPPRASAVTRLRSTPPAEGIVAVSTAYATPAQTQQVPPPPPLVTTPLHSPGSVAARANKGRTGWPQHVWALELGGGTGGCAPPDLDSGLY